MELDDFSRHYIIRYLSARELVLPPWYADIALGDFSISPSYHTNQ